MGDPRPVRYSAYRAPGEAVARDSDVARGSAAMKFSMPASGTAEIVRLSGFELDSGRKRFVRVGKCVSRSPESPSLLILP